MTVKVEFLENKKLKALFDGFEVLSDQPESGGGDNSAPSPFDYFPVATALCAAHFARAFCLKRDLDYTQISIEQKMERIEEGSAKRLITIEVGVPADFPEKYHKALLASVNSCAVKKLVQAGPEFEVNIVKI